MRNTIKLHFFIILIFILFLPGEFLKSDDFSNSLSLFRDKFKSIYYSFDSGAYSKYISDLKKEKNNLEKSPFFWYYLAFAEHNYGKIIYNENKVKAYKQFENADIHISKAKSLTNNNNFKNEFNILHADILAKKSSLETLSRISTGRKSERIFRSVWEKDSTNPKAMLIAAIQLMHIPLVFGGDKAKAEYLLQKACKSANNKSDERIISWAEIPEIYAYLAQLRILKKDYESANYYMKKSLSLQPQYGFVLIDLKNQMSNE